MYHFRQCVKLSTQNNRNETKNYEINIKKDGQEVPHTFFAHWIIPSLLIGRVHFFM